jgi:rubrerythrin
MPSLKGTRTEQNLEGAFAGESRANRRCLRLARDADVEGLKDLAAVLRSTAERRTGHAHGHLDYLQEVGDPAGPPGDILEAAIASETHEYIDMYAGMARVARQEGVDELADWFETLAKAGKWPVGRFRKVLDAL